MDGSLVPVATSQDLVYQLADWPSSGIFSQLPSDAKGSYGVYSGCSEPRAGTLGDVIGLALGTADPLKAGRRLAASHGVVMRCPRVTRLIENLSFHSR
jgi:hypothetical protein